MLLDILLIFLAAAGLMLIVWCVTGLFLSPVFDQSTVSLCYISGEAEALETRVKAYAWLRGSGIAGGKLVLVDCGITGGAMARVERLREHHHWLDYCTQEDAPAKP